MGDIPEENHKSLVKIGFDKQPIALLHQPTLGFVGVRHHLLLLGLLGRSGLGNSFLFGSREKVLGGFHVDAPAPECRPMLDGYHFVHILHVTRQVHEAGALELTRSPVGEHPDLCALSVVNHILQVVLDSSLVHFPVQLPHKHHRPRAAHAALPPAAFTLPLPPAFLGQLLAVPRHRNPQVVRVCGRWRRGVRGRLGGLLGLCLLPLLFGRLLLGLLLLVRTSLVGLRLQCFDHLNFGLRAALALALLGLELLNHFCRDLRVVIVGLVTCVRSSWALLRARWRHSKVQHFSAQSPSDRIGCSGSTCLCRPGERLFPALSLLQHS
mmetsp:Transcript_34657/g.77509  ORF Transcript_34657/g.77509 Transcript_34657/m.77509 type:complete len:324 (-) Transcript_34657:138-1109(-)